jgi:two-component system, NtrC family, response regulator AlgB
MQDVRPGPGEVAQGFLCKRESARVLPGYQAMELAAAPAMKPEHSAGLQPLLLESRNPAMRNALVTAQQAGSCDANILLTGESGTGKSLLAAAIHQWSARRDAAFVTVPFTSLGESLLASELFGHVKGAFTGAWKDKPGRLEAVHGGTLFFDEIGELPLDLQAKLLRFVEEHRFERLGSTESIAVDARIVAATSRDLERDVRVGRFRPDLFFRLNVISIRLPPLRDRTEDLPALTAHVLNSLRRQHGRVNLHLGADAQQTLAEYSWPGNVRELVNALEHAVVVTRGSAIRAENLPDRIRARRPIATVGMPPETNLTLEQLERRRIEQVLGESRTLDEAARRLGINPTTLWRKRKRYGIG